VSSGWVKVGGGSRLGEERFDDSKIFNVWEGLNLLKAN
jgi:hypothetical protein